LEALSGHEVVSKQSKKATPVSLFHFLSCGSVVGFTSFMPYFSPPSSSSSLRYVIGDDDTMYSPLTLAQVLQNYNWQEVKE
jgi:hypothetical protein